MNSASKAVRAAGIVLLLLMVLVPPWRISFTGPDHAPGSESIGYRPIWYRLEQAEDDPRTDVKQRINLLRLGLQLGAVLLLTNAGLAMMEKRG